MEGGWAGQVYTVLLSKVTMSQQFYPWLQAVIWTPTKNEWNVQNTIFFFNVSLREFPLTYFFVTGEPRLHKPSGFFWDPLPIYSSDMYSCIVLYFG